MEEKQIKFWSILDKKTDLVIKAETETKGLAVKAETKNSMMKAQS